MADLPPAQKAGFMDRELRQGHEWPERLSNALATCRVFVPLYSRRYFKSEHCGKEWFAFNRRRLNHKAKNAQPGRDDRARRCGFPMPDDLLPEAATSVQYNAAGFSPLYAEHGFYGIMKVSRWRDVYEEAVYLLAKRIVTAAEASPPVGPGGNVPYESLPSAFGGQGAAGPGDKPLRVTVVAPSRDELPAGRDRSYYGKDIQEWNPYRQDSMRLARGPRGGTRPGACLTPPRSATCTGTRPGWSAASRRPGPRCC